jgi:hypothetical protein
VDNHDWFQDEAKLVKHRIGGAASLVRVYRLASGVVMGDVFLWIQELRNLQSASFTKSFCSLKKKALNCLSRGVGTI